MTKHCACCSKRYVFLTSAPEPPDEHRRDGTAPQEAMPASLEVQVTHSGAPTRG